MQNHADMGDEVDQVRAILSAVPDPEIPVISVMELGIVRKVDHQCVEITPTYTGCPATTVIETMIREALDQEGFENWSIKTVLAPPWTTDWISDEGRQKLLDYGIAPPPKGDGKGTLKEPSKTHCPQCRSSNVEEISQFGSTPCKALMRCLDCAEPFDRFKCI